MMNIRNQLETITVHCIIYCAVVNCTFPFKRLITIDVKNVILSRALHHLHLFFILKKPLKARKTSNDLLVRVNRKMGSVRAITA